ncbi:hypothetical protein J4409_00170 [Candidatus Woesearchaeota archaeon]|nr:hypothetical protein [Candidatus Woesearchaeota archaeon]
MVDQIKREVANLKNLEEFKEYKNKYPNSYLCAGFMIMESNDGSKWQLDYYCPDNDHITTFCLKDKVEVKESKAVHRDKKKIRELNLENVDIGLNEALEITSSLRDKNYPGEKANKIIVILQNIEKKEIWNVTYLTASFKVLNTNIDAQTGGIMKEKLENVLNFKLQ